MDLDLEMNNIFDQLSMLYSYIMRIILTFLCRNMFHASQRALRELLESSDYVMQVSHKRISM